MNRRLEQTEGGHSQGVLKTDTVVAEEDRVLDPAERSPAAESLVTELSGYFPGVPFLEVNFRAETNEGNIDGKLHFDVDAGTASAEMHRFEWPGGERHWAEATVGVGPGIINYYSSDIPGSLQDQSPSRSTRAVREISGLFKKAVGFLQPSEKPTPPPTGN